MSPPRLLLLLAAGLLAACGAPDYGRVTQWAVSASLAADVPAVASGAPALPGRPAADTVRSQGIRAMQQALVTYLAALSRLSDDGVLPFREDPFVEAAPRAAAADEEGGRAVAALAARTAAAIAATRDPATRQLLAEWAALRDAALAAAARAAHAGVPACIAEGHALLRAEAPRRAQQETRRRIAEAKTALLRAAAAVPRFGSAPRGAASRRPSAAAPCSRSWATA